MKRIVYNSLLSISDNEWIIESVTDDGSPIRVSLPRAQCALFEDKNVAVVPESFLARGGASLKMAGAMTES